MGKHQVIRARSWFWGRTGLGMMQQISDFLLLAVVRALLMEARALRARVRALGSV